MKICTVVATNYLAQARVLARSFATHHPDGTCHVLVIDDVEGRIDEAAEPFSVLRPSDLDLAAELFDEMRAAYNVLELSTALKPWLLAHMLSREADGSGVAYLDPDIWVTSPMVELQRVLLEDPIVLTPHLTSPLPIDGRRPSETDILVAGAYNLGFIGLGSGPVAGELLAWWCERLRRHCRVLPERGMFVDQRWMDFAPGLHPGVHILRLPGYNLAYWNAPTRELVNGRNGITVDGQPLRFFHFSGYSPLSPDELSLHQDRIALADEPLLQNLCNDYRDQLLAAGFAQECRRPYGHGRLPDGLVLDEAVRELYRNGLERCELSESIFTEYGSATFQSWLNAPVNDEGTLTRYLHGLWAMRPDLRRAFPDVCGADLGSFLAWCEHHGRSRGAIPDALAPTGPMPAEVAGGAAHLTNAQPPDPRVNVVAVGVPTRRPLGVNVVGYLGAALGVGEVARQLIGALDAADVPVLPISLPAERSPDADDVTATATPGPFGINIVCVNADMFPAFARDVGPEFFAGRYTVGFWWWELDSFPPQFQRSFELVDEVWVGSRFVADALARVAPVRVVHMPVAVTFPAVDPLRVGEFGWPDAFTVAYSWDYNSVFARKNPLGAIEAYCAAFAPHDGAALVLKCINHDRHPSEHDEIRAAAAGRPDIVLIDEQVAARDKNRLMASCDCYLSLHRAEGLGLTMAEAMFYATPVVATGYSGNADFLTSVTGFPVNYELVAIGPGLDPYPADGRWAQPDVQHAAQLLREVFEDRRGARRIAAEGRDTIARRYAPAVVGAAIERRLREIERDHRPSALIRQPRPDAGRARAEELVKRRGTPRFPSRFGLAGAALRRFVLRIMRPYTAYQADVNDVLLASIDRAEQRVEEIGAQSELQVAKMRAEMLRAVRRQQAVNDELLAASAARDAADPPVSDWPARPEETASASAGADAFGAFERDTAAQVAGFGAQERITTTPEPRRAAEFADHAVMERA